MPAARCSLSAFHISLPASRLHRRVLGKSRAWVRDQVRELIPYARAHFDYLSVGAQDASRAAPRVLKELARTVRDAGGDRFRLADTVGIWNPFQVHRAVSRLRSQVPGLEIAFHGHDDLGMATANSLSAIVAGARGVDVTVNGLGKRAGNAPLEQVVMALKLTLRRNSGVATDALGALCRRVADLASRPIPPGQPITGAGVFRHESGIHVHALLRDRRTYEPFPPSAVGAAPGSFALGKHSGTAALNHVLDQQGIHQDGQHVQTLLSRVRREAEARHGAVLPSELAQWSRELNETGFIRVEGRRGPRVPRTVT